MQRSGVGALGVAALALLWVAGCGETTEERAASGGLGGAAAGAVVGGPVGAVVGGAAGATGGTVLEKSVDENAEEAAD
jgi:osmotically inducible lipoprotein OsmB